MFFVFVLFVGVVSDVSYGLPFMIDENLVENSSEVIANFSKFANYVFGVPDESVGQKIADWSAGVVSVDEAGPYFQGDILIPREQGRNGLVDLTMRWTNGTIPYVISREFGVWDSYAIKRAFYEFEKRTCLRFVPRSRKIHQDFVYIQNTFTGCWSSVGRIGGRQEVNIQSPGCNQLGTIMHELLHAIGFWHEQSRDDRDEFISVQWENIEEGFDYNFYKADPGESSSYGIPYDYYSILHYSPHSFSKNGKPTIVATRPGGDKMGQRIRLSKRDILKINHLYDCKEFLPSRPEKSNGD